MKYQNNEWLHALSSPLRIHNIYYILIKEILNWMGE
ncbi:hypothetical protein DET57_1187 [Klebsiella oxytoca]|uniref:Uncharacterized protein n=1 Tax=Klebsiella oxytoca TaxID=571 RepID=A0A318FKZ2_KLEOX|nr:hypothetical protein DET57_1187 [Klebsiella oxytoca]